MRGLGARRRTCGRGGSGEVGVVVRRLLKAVATAGATQIVLVLLLTATVPVFLHFWGVRLFSEWLVLSAVPGYLTFADLGFSVVLANEMAVRAAAGDRDRAVEAFQSVLLAVTLILVGVFGASLVPIFLAPLHAWLRLEAIAPAAMRATLVLLCLQVLVNIEGAVITAGYKCDGHYARGILATCWIRVGEFAAAVAALAGGCGPCGVSGAVLASRIAGLTAATCDLKRRSPWIEIGWRRASRARIGELMGPSLAANGLPIGHALSFQGMPIAISSALGPVAAGTFATLRNLSRMPVQLITAAASGGSAEFCAVVGRQDLATARRLLRRVTQLVLWGTAAMLALLAAFGAPIYRVWTMHRYAFDARLYLVLLVVIVPSTVWIHMSSTAVILRRHRGITAFYVLCTALCVGCAALFGRSFGAVFCALALLAFDSLAAAAALFVTVRALEDDVWDFVRFVATPPVGWIAARARSGWRDWA